ncbi:MAG: methionyl-tRNA formyltransferase [endosymbiont of Galathealinum brachiosum]|uniref:Methionyl-tRNA formyltransferase n=1 Tax=endosymbiont of Galathealinum brachiosum TaxID=2200906 RepID=A0A370DE42_9GAMM|nr:MAG: methionyl-tRNA formyltransferase [endosymbiont of Galathealinum brachiosum]
MSDKPLKIIFAGTPDFSVAPLKELIDSEHDVVAVYTQPDRPAGRGRKLSPSPVKACALEYGIPVYQPEKLKAAEDQQPLIDLKADLMVVVAYGIILPEVVLNAPRLGCINIHASLLPRWRGAAPIQRAILAGDTESGITIMQMDIGLDTGDMLLKTRCDIETDDTGSSLHDRLALMGAEALMEALPGIANETLKGEKQDESLTNYANKLQKAEALIDWNKSATELQRQVNAFNAWPVAQTPIEVKGKTQMLRIWRAQAVEGSGEQAGKVISCNKQGIDVVTGEGLLRLLEIQMPGKKPMDVKAFVNANDISGILLG